MLAGVNCFLLLEMFSSLNKGVKTSILNRDVLKFLGPGDKPFTWKKNVVSLFYVVFKYIYNIVQKGSMQFVKKNKIVLSND